MSFELTLEMELTLISATHLQDTHGLDTTSVWNVRTDTKIDHWSTSVDGGRGSISDLGRDDVRLVFVVLRRGEEERGTKRERRARGDEKMLLESNELNLDRKSVV